MGPRLEFPRGFFWGTSTSSHQVEGNNDNNDWSEWEKRPGAITDGTRAGAACGWWDGRAEQDLAAAATAGQNAHRLSLEWSRLEPEPGRWDNAAFGRYARLLEEMRHLGLRAMVTLQHVTLPLWLARRGAWTSWEAVDAFARYAEECARRLDGRVDSWVTMNEPAAVAGAAYALTYWPPGLGSSRAALRALAVMLEAHAAGYQAVKRVAPRAAVGIVLSAPRLEPARRTLSDRGITWVQDWAFLASTLFALRTGILPLPLRGRRARVPGLRGATDFLGVNYYGRYAVRFDPQNAALLFGRHVQEPTVRTGRCADTSTGRCSTISNGRRAGLRASGSPRSIRPRSGAHRGQARRCTRKSAVPIRSRRDARGYFSSGSSILYPLPRTVSIRSRPGPSFSRSRLMCVSTVRVCNSPLRFQTSRSSAARVCRRPTRDMKVVSSLNSSAVSATSSFCTKARCATGSIRSGPTLSCSTSVSPCNPRRSTARTRRTSSRMLNGLVTKSSAPSSNPTTRSTSSPRAVTMMTGTCFDRGELFSCRQTSVPGTPGSMRSSSTRSGSRLRTRSSACSPSRAPAVSNPLCRRLN